jgi:hypothetical protein
MLHYSTDLFYAPSMLTTKNHPIGPASALAKESRQHPPEPLTGHRPDPISGWRSAMPRVFGVARNPR